MRSIDSSEIGTLASTGKRMRTGAQLHVVGPTGAVRTIFSITRLDREPGPELSDLDRLITLAYARFDLGEGTLRFVDCGHTKTVRGHPDQDVEFLVGSNPPMGIVLNDEIIEHAIALRHGDVYVFYSDGLIEAENEAGDQFGQERAGEVVLEHISDPVETILSALDKLVREFMAADGFDEDFTVAVVRVL